MSEGPPNVLLLRPNVALQISNGANMIKSSSLRSPSMEILGIPIPHIIPVPFGPLFPKNILELKQIVDHIGMNNQKHDDKNDSLFEDS
jgi:hypothetical protein